MTETLPRPATDDPSAPPFGAALRRYRTARRLSQLDLALACGISPRHLSFLETGRARPSREMVLHLAEGLDLSRQARNELLGTAGFAAAFPQTPLDAETLRPFRAALGLMLERHEPFPALVCDRHWTLRDANRAAQALLAPLQGGSGETNLIRLLTQEGAATGSIVNLPELLADMTERLRLEALECVGDPVLAELQRDLARARDRLGPTPRRTTRSPLVPLVLATPAGELRLLSAVAHFGTSEDVTIRDLRLELFFPADEATRAAFLGR